MSEPRAVSAGRAVKRASRGRMTTAEMLHELTVGLEGTIKGADSSRERRIDIYVGSRDVIDTLQYLYDEFNIYHISAITGLDTGDHIGVIYHLWGRGNMISVHTEVPETEPVLDTILKVFPGALIYERELMELFGVKIKGHEHHARTFLPDSWGNKGAPLRKGWGDEKKAPRKENITAKKEARS